MVAHSRGICSSLHRIHADESFALLCHPVEAEGSAVLSTASMRTKASPPPLSSRAKPRDLQFPLPAANADRSTRRKLQSPGFVSGHDFSRAVNA
jgi:hypothetical protein